MYCTTQKEKKSTNKSLIVSKHNTRDEKMNLHKKEKRKREIKIRVVRSLSSPREILTKTIPRFGNYNTDKL